MRIMGITTCIALVMNTRPKLTAAEHRGSGAGPSAHEMLPQILLPDRDTRCHHPDRFMSDIVLEISRQRSLDEPHIQARCRDMFAATLVKSLAKASVGGL